MYVQSPNHDYLSLSWTNTTISLAAHTCLMNTLVFERLCATSAPVLHAQVKLLTAVVPPSRVVVYSYHIHNRIAPYVAHRPRILLLS